MPRPNKFAGRCWCGQQVAAGAGLLVGSPGNWGVECQNHSARATPPLNEAAVTPPWCASAPNAADSGTYKLISGHEASSYQAAVFDHFRSGRGSRIVKAVAGAGKTTTIKNAIRYLGDNLHVVLLAFNTEAAGQLADAIVELRTKDARPYRNVSAKTFHSLGFYAVRKYLNGRGIEKINVDSGKCSKIFREMVSQDMGSAYGSFVTQLVSFAKGEGIGPLVPDTDERWFSLISHHGMYLETEALEDGTPVTEEFAVKLARDLLNRSNDQALSGNLDFDDQLYMVLKWKLRLWQNDVVVCDEAQDTNPTRRALLRLALKPGGRLYAVGDPKQAIYGFTGASCDAMDLIAQEFGTQELPLTVSYRCARSVVTRAQSWVSYIESHENATEGSVKSDVPLMEAVKILTKEDAILCRQTRPLVSLAYGLIARGRACRIMGREIGEGLVQLIEKQRAAGINRLVDKLEAFRDREVAKFTAKGDEQRAEAVADKVDCVLTIIGALDENNRTVPALIAKIRSMFSDDDTGVLTLATVHKAKGQEWNQVAILRPDLMPSSFARQDWQYEQELNLCYVACTRAKTNLIYVTANDEGLGK